MTTNAWTFVMEGNEDDDFITDEDEEASTPVKQTAPVVKEEPAPKTINTVEPPKNIQTNGTTTTTNTKEKKDNSKEWNFTGARLKPHVVGVYFDGISQYMGNWKQDAKESKGKKTNNAANAQLRPRKQITKSLKRAHQRVSAPSALNKSSHGSPSQYSVRNFANPNASSLFQQHPHPVNEMQELNYGNSTNVTSQRQPDFRGSHIPSFNQLTSNREDRQHPQHLQHPQHPQHPQPQQPVLVQRHLSDNSQFGPEPLYRSTSLPNRYAPATPDHDLLDLLNYSLNDFAPQKPTRFPDNNDQNPNLPRQSMMHSSQSNITNFQGNGARIQPTHVYFNDTNSPNSSPFRQSHESMQHDNNSFGFGRDQFGRQSHNPNSSQYYNNNNSNNSAPLRSVPEPSYPPLQNSRNQEYYGEQSGSHRRSSGDLNPNQFVNDGRIYY